mgnify:CR=1 FL=1
MCVCVCVCGDCRQVVSPSQVEAFDQSLAQLLPSATRALLLSPTSDVPVGTLSWGTHDTPHNVAVRHSPTNSERDCLTKTARVAQLDETTVWRRLLRRAVLRHLPHTWRSSTLFKSPPREVQKVLCDPGTYGIGQPLPLDPSSRMPTFARVVPVQFVSHLCMGLAASAVAPVVMRLLHLC